MKRANGAKAGQVRVVLPATSANLGPGFDAVGVALSLALTVEARAAEEDSIEAVGRDAKVCGRLQKNLIFESYRTSLRQEGMEVVPLALRVENAIPLGMGCGSSAAARIAGVVLANHFGGLGWTDKEIVAVASRLEGHPDNVAACWYGGFTVSVPHRNGVAAATFAGDGAWQLMLALPANGVATEKARSVLPESYTRSDAVFNVQRAALLTAAFAQARLDLLGVAMDDRLHQPFRREVCGLLRNVERLQQAEEFAGVALSGAGPALLAVLRADASVHGSEAKLRSILGDVETVPVRIAGGTSVETF